MKNKVLKAVMVIALIITLTIADFVLLGTKLVTYALENDSVAFAAYFKTEEGEVPEVGYQMNSSEMMLYLKIEVIDQGFFDCGLVTLSDNSNFKIKPNNENEYIKEIVGNKIYLEKITGAAEIPIEIEPVIEESYEISMLSAESTLTLEGDYNDGIDSFKTVNAEAIVTLNLTVPENIDTTLDVATITNKEYAISGANKRIIQIELNSTVIDNSYPIESSIFDVALPDGVEGIEVITQGTYATNGEADRKLSYEEDNQVLYITIENPSKDGKVSWKKDASDNIIITLILSNDQEITADEYGVKAKVKLYDQNTIEKETTYNLIGETDEIIRAKSESKEEIYKGKLYSKEDREYTTITNLEVNYANLIEGNTLQETTMYTKDSENILADNIEYKTTTINKAEIEKILGTEGIIIIQNGSTQEQITAEREADDEAGNIVITYEAGVTELYITVTNAIEVGTIKLKHTKVIKADDSLTDENIDAFKYIVEVGVVKYGTEENTYVGMIELKDVSAEVGLIVPETVSAESNRDMQITLTLKTDNEKYELFENPRFLLEIPEGLIINGLSNGTILPENDEFTISRLEQEGERRIWIDLEGNQEKYVASDINTQISFTANVNVNKLMPNKMDTVKMAYTNKENVYEIESNAINIIASNSKIFTNIKVENYDGAGSTLGRYSDTEEYVYGELPIENTEEIEVPVTYTIINNYDTAVTVSPVIETFLTDTTGARTRIDSYAELYLTVEANSTLVVNESFNIKSGLYYNEQVEVITQVDYTYLGITDKISNSIELATEDKEGAREQSIIDNKLKVETFTQLGDGSGVLETDEVYNEQIITYIVEVTNISNETISNLVVTNTQENGNIYDLKEIEVINFMIQPEPFYEHRYAELDTSTKTFETIETLNPGESKELICRVVVKKTDESSITSANITISAEEIAEISVQKISNNVKDSDFKIISRKSLSEEVEIYGNTTFLLLTNVKNLTQEDINNASARIYLSEGLVWRESSFVEALDLNEANLDIIGEVTYNAEENYIEFEITELEASQEIIITTMMYTNEVPIEEVSTEENLYAEINNIISNCLKINIEQQQTKLTVSQSINIEDEQKLKDGEKVIITGKVTNEGAINSEATIKDYFPDGLEPNTVTIIQNGERIDKTSEEQGSVILITLELNAGETVEIEIEATINTARIVEDSIENMITVISANGEIADSNKIVLNIEKPVEDETGDGNEEIDPEPVPDPEEPTENEDPDVEDAEPETQETTSVTVSKIWEDNNDQDRKRSDYTIMVIGKVGEEEIYSDYKTLTADQTEYTFENLPKYSNGEEIEYTIDETEMPSGYTKEINGYTITNRYTPETTSVTIMKIWIDNNNQYEKRSDYEITLTGKVGEEIVFTYPLVLVEDETECRFDNLNKYWNGEIIEYTVDETVVPEGYTKEINGFTITNTYIVEESDPEDTETEEPETTSVTVKKVWDDNNNQYETRTNYEITLTGKVGETIVYTDSATLSSEQIECRWINLDRYSNGEEIEYTVDETVVPEGYAKEVNGFTITNKYTAEIPTPEEPTPEDPVPEDPTPEDPTPDETEKISVTVTKVWDDNSNEYGKRANYEITLTGKVGEEIVYTDSVTLRPDEIEHTWENLEKYWNEEEIEYIVDETEVPEGYTKEVNGFTITNKYTEEVTTPEETEKISLVVTKIWDDNNNKYGKRGNYEITLTGRVGGKVVYTDVATLTPDNTECRWLELDKYSNGEEIEYTVDETEVPEGYTKEVNGFTITNKYTAKDPTPEKPEEPTYTISGIVWFDENKNSIKEQAELISDVIVKVMDLNNNNTFLKDKNGKEIEVKTDENGEYAITGIEKGNYNLIFKYDTSLYELAENDGIKDYIIESTKEKVAITNKINLSSDKTIDLKLMELTEFNLKIDKYISKVIVQTTNGTKTTGYVNKQFAREEIQNKYLTGATVLVEYTLEISNIGELAGYATEIRDYLPDDMKFHSELNTQWYAGEDGNLYNTSLSSNTINPGENKTVKLVLLKTMTKDNTGLTSNIAEISETMNTKEYEDIDLNNNQSKAELIVNPSTGAILTYVIAVLNAVAIVALGMYIIKKKVIK